jgi:hypothetical protein
MFGVVFTKRKSSRAGRLLRWYADEIRFEPVAGGVDSGLSGGDLDAVVRELKTLSDAVSAGTGSNDALLSSTVVDMKTVATTSLFVVPTGKSLVITRVVIRNPTASLAGGVDYDLTDGSTDWIATLDLSGVITTASYHVATAPTNAPVYVAADDFGIAVVTGSTLAANATVEVFGYLV